MPLCFARIHGELLMLGVDVAQSTARLGIPNKNDR